MMKIKVLLFVLILAFTLDGCNKTKDVNGVVLVTVTYSGRYMPNTTVYMKRGAVANPSIALSAYDQNASTNSSGQVYFQDLPEDKYYFYVKTVANFDTVTGGYPVTVTSKPRPNVYDVTVGLSR